MCVCEYTHIYMYEYLCKCILSHFSHVQFFETGACTCTVHRTVVHQAPLSMEFSRYEYWSGLPCPPPGYLPNRGIEPASPWLLHCRWILYP